nr:MAG TPA: hypothetical protein [Caudoviricetes sp.]
MNLLYYLILNNPISIPHGNSISRFDLCKVILVIDRHSTALNY